MFLFLSLVDSDEDSSKLIQIYNLYRGTMIHIARGMLNEDDTEDAVSMAMIKIIGSIHRFTTIDSHETRALIVIIVRNVARDILRKQRRLSEVPIDEEFEIGTPDLTFEAVTAREAVELIADCINELDSIYSEIIYLSERGYSRRDMSEILGISEDNARKRLSRARQSLKLKLAERGLEHESNE